jgi:sialate O-acetylesterase
MTRRPLILIACLIPFAGGTSADVRLPKVFTDHMVLQRELPIRIWGRAAAGEKVTVEFNNKSATATAGPDGHWRADLPPMPSDGKPHSLTVKGQNTIELKDVFLGEVWLAVGQSNMSRGLRYVKDRAKAEPMTSPNYRLFFVGLDQVPREDEPAVTKGWAPATHESMNNVFVHEKLGPYEFSEVTYYFGKHVHEKLNVPVGMISAAFPGSTPHSGPPPTAPPNASTSPVANPTKAPAPCTNP